tara:strand:+ start:2440 stop:2637 length:198 start_codon:yes stop_codon:yes gene_type:complete
LAILRNGPLLDINNRTINATRFVNALEKSLENYVMHLRANDFNSETWKNAISKIEDICENCNTSR